MKAAGRRHRRPEPPRLRRRRLRLRHPGLRRPDAGRQAQHRRQAGQPDHRRPQPHEPGAPATDGRRRRPSSRPTTTAARSAGPTSPSTTDGAVSDRLVADDRLRPPAPKDPTIDGARSRATRPTRPTWRSSTRRSATAPSTCARSNTGDNMMGTFIDDAIYNYLNSDGTTGERRRPLLQQRRRHPHRLVLRTAAHWVNTGCAAGTARPGAPDLRQHVHDPAVRQRDGRRDHDRRPDPRGRSTTARTWPASSSRRASSTSTTRTRTPTPARSRTPGAPSTSASSTRPRRPASRST